MYSDSTACSLPFCRGLADDEGGQQADAQAAEHRLRERLVVIDVQRG